MKKLVRRGMALLLSVLLLCSLSVEALAADEVGITAVLDNAKITKSDAAQTVTLTIAPQSAVTACAVGMQVIVPDGWSIASITNDDPNMQITSGDVNLNNGKIVWATADMTDTTISKFAIYTITVPAGTEAGDYELKVIGVDVTKNSSTEWVMTDATTASATLTIEDSVTPPAPEEPDGYSVSAAGSTAISIGADAAVSLNVSHKDESPYNAYYFEVNYDSTVLTYKGASEGAAVDSTTDGVLKIVGYGAEKTSGSTAVALTFNGKAAGSGTVTITKANVDAKENANAQNAPAAAISETAPGATITVGGYSVTLPDGFTGEPTATAGEDYSFTGPVDSVCYDVTATMGGADATVRDNNDGTYTIENVSGEIKVTATPKSYDVTVDGSGKDQVRLSGNKATYKTDYTFTLTKKGDDYSYDVSVKVGGNEYSGFTSSNGTYTIPGADVKGKIEITVTETAPAPKTTAITIEGIPADEVDGGKPTLTAPNGQDFSFKIVKQDGFTYAAKIGDDALTVAEDGTVTIPGSRLGGTALTVTITKTSQNPYGVKVYEYVKLAQQQSVWLIVAKSDSTLKYGADVMFTSEKYKGCCWLVISGDNEDTVKAAAIAAVAAGEGDAQAIAYSGDVNVTGLVDVNDAQLVYNIYNTVYNSFDATTRRMFLEADMNGDKTVNVNDATAVVNKVLGK